MQLDRDALDLLSQNTRQLVLPHLVAIYEPIDEVRVHQVGTGVCVDFESRQFLVTARHTLFGHTGGDNPGDKAVLLAGGLRQIGDLQAPGVFSSPAFDLASVELKGEERRQALTPAHFHAGTGRPTFITICGYLARDFRRKLSESTLAPRPFIYSNYSTATPRGFIGLRYPKCRNRDTKTRQLVMTPTPRGLSGGPMLDSIALAQGQLQIVGIFTDKPNGKGIAFGEVAAKVLAMLQVVAEKAA
jgi:hypothetical protein